MNLRLIFSLIVLWVSGLHVFIAFVGFGILWVLADGSIACRVKGFKVLVVVWVLIVVLISLKLHLSVLLYVLFPWFSIIFVCITVLPVSILLGAAGTLSASSTAFVNLIGARSVAHVCSNSSSSSSCVASGQHLLLLQELLLLCSFLSMFVQNSIWDLLDLAVAICWTDDTCWVHPVLLLSLPKLIVRLNPLDWQQLFHFLDHIARLQVFRVQIIIWILDLWFTDVLVISKVELVKINLLAEVRNVTRIFEGYQIGPPHEQQSLVLVLVVSVLDQLGLFIFIHTHLVVLLPWIVICLLGWLWVGFKPFKQVCPMFNVTSHPILYFRNSESDLNYKVDHDFHPLINVQLGRNKVLEKIFEPYIYQVPLCRWFPRLKHILEKNQEWFDILVIVLLQAKNDSLPHLLQMLRIVVAMMDVCFSNCCHRPRFRGCANKLLNEISLRHD